MKSYGLPVITGNVKNNIAVAVLVCLLAMITGHAHAWQSDNGDGTYTNPPLYADYPDPDLIRVGNDFYMASTTFVNSPGLTLLRSPDLVNWEIASHVIDPLDGNTLYDMNGGTAYRSGVFAPSLRYYNGTYYVVVTPVGQSTRVYYSADITGSWQYHQLNVGAFDPGFFIDDDGTGYIFSSGGWDGHVTVHTLNSTYSSVVTTTNDVFYYDGIEGCKVVKKDGYYYVFNSRPTWESDGFWLMCSRSTDIFGTYETITNLTEFTGGHQGAIVDLPDGSWYGFVMKDCGAIGRMTYISPIFWEDDWPVWGTTAARDQVPATATKPIQGQPIMQPATSDDFSSTTLGLQWQWNHNPDNSKWSLSERPGYLRLKPTQSDGLWTARNTLIQKGQGPWSRGEVRFDLQNLQPGDVCGFGTFGKYSAHIAVHCDNDGSRFLSMNVLEDTSSGIDTDTRITSVPIQSDTILLRTDMDFETDTGLCSYSFDGVIWTSLGGEFPLAYDWATGTFQGQQFAIFCYNPNPAGGYVDVDSFTFSDTDNPVNLQRGRPVLNATGTTFVADNGNLLRGPFASTEWGDPPSSDAIESIRPLGCNAVHLYAECFDIDYPAAGSTSPGYSLSRIDEMVEMTRDAGLYLIITIGNGANNGAFNYDYVMDFWSLYAPLYKDETHVIYEIQNEPHAWSAPYPQAALDMEADAYTLIRLLAPETPVLLFSFSVLGDGPNAVADIQSVSAAASIDWSNAGVAFHGYAGHEATTASVEDILAAGYPCFMTEFTAADWGSHTDVLDVELTAELERLAISWLTFQNIPPNFIGTAVTDSFAFYDMVNNGGLSWTSDYGSWPGQRGIYGNGGVPRATAGLSGTLRVEAEDFDTGGQGVAYNDTDSGNQGGQYRTGESVDIEATSDSDGSYNVGWIADGEWFEYTVFISEPGYYDLDLRIASQDESGVVRIICNDSDKTGLWSLPNTGGFQNWAAASRNVFLEYGRQKLRIEIESGGFNLNWIELSPITSGVIADGTYKLLNRNSALAVEADTANYGVEQNTYSGTSVQTWNIQHRGAGQYSIVSASNGWSWSTFYDRNGEPLSLAAWGYDGAADRRFILIPTDNDYFRIAVADGGLTIEIEDASAAVGAAAQQYEYSGDVHQDWGVLAPSAPAFPTGLTAGWTSFGQVDLAWTASPDATSYNVKRSTTSGGPYTTIATDVMTASYSDGSATMGVSYYYVVSANSANGESLHSHEASPQAQNAHLRFDETGVTTASDSTGNGWTGTLINGPVWSPGKFGYAVELDGSNDYVSLPTGVVEGLTDCTVAAWVYQDSVSNWSRIFDFGSGTGNYMFLTPQNGMTGTIRFAITTGSGEEVIEGSEPLDTGVWTHVAVTLSGSEGVLYVDGVEGGRNSSMSLSPDSLGSTTQNYIGWSQYSWDPHLDGRVDEFRIYGTALSASEIEALYSEQVPVVPSVPTSLGATAVSGSQIDLSWDAVGGATSYNVKRSTVSGGSYTVIASSTGAGYSDTGLSESTTYYYIFSAVNSAGESDDSTQVEATTHSVAPVAPSGLSATAGDASMTLNWNANVEGDLAGYNVYRSTTSGSGYVLQNTALLSSPQFTDHNVTNFTTYYYVITAVDDDSLESSYSGEVESMPDDGSIVQLGAVDFESGFGDWINNTDADSHDWIRDSGGTTTPNAGPDSGANDSSWYAYFETSPGGANSAGDTAILESPDLYGVDRVLRFYYHMYGVEIGTLSVDVYDGSWNNAVWSLSGQQHSAGSDGYTQATVDLSGYPGLIKIRFRAEAAGGPRGDMAIDDIVISGRTVYGDMNHDNLVNENDLPDFIGYWLQSNCGLDLDGDCVITLYEFSEFANNWLND